MASKCVRNPPCQWYYPHNASWSVVDGQVQYDGGIASQNYADSFIAGKCDHMLSEVITSGPYNGLHLYTCDGTFCPDSCHFCDPATSQESACMTDMLTSYSELKN